MSANENIVSNGSGVVQEPSPKYAEAIANAKRRNTRLAVIIERTECFAVSWRDENGTCEHAATCGLAINRNLCEKAWQEARVLARPPKPPKKPPPKRRRRIPLVPKHKWNGTKYVRSGYCASNRPVDAALGYFLSALHNPPQIPDKHWRPVSLHTDKYNWLGRVVLSQSTSFTTVIVDGVTVLRFWTNASSCAWIDVTPALTKHVSRIVSNLEEVPDGVRKKLRPCEHRFSLDFGQSVQPNVLSALADMITMAYQLNAGMELSSD